MVVGELRDHYVIGVESTLTISEEGGINTWVWALPLATAKLGGVPRYRITITFIFTAFLSSILLIIF